MAYNENVEEKRMVRMNSNTNATAIVTALIERGQLNLPIGLDMREELKDTLKEYSEFFEGLVYKGFEEKK